MGELLIERNEQAPMSDEYQLMAFIANEGVAPKGERYDRSSLVSDNENKLYKKTEFGDFIYSSNNLETGSIGLNKYGNASISPVYSVFQPTEIADSDFLGRRLIRKDFINSMVKWRQGVIYGQWRIHESDFIKIEIFVPSFEEQKKIGSFLNSLDYLITLHQRKLDMLKKMKRAYLQQMFPEDGESIPRLRFAGFEGKWDQRKLGEVVDVNSGTDYKHLNKGDIPVYGTGGYMLSVDGKLSDVNAIGIGRKGTIDRPQILKAPFWTVDTLFYMIPYKNYDLYFLYSMANKIPWKQYDESTGVPSLSKTIINNISLFFPSCVEQKKIGIFFKSFDDIIALHQTELDKLNLLKKSYLQKMFT